MTNYCELQGAGNGCKLGFCYGLVDQAYGPFDQVHVYVYVYGLAYGLVDQTYNELQVTLVQLTKNMMNY